VVTTLSVTTAASATTMPPSPGDAVTVAEAARLLGRDRTRVLHVAAPEETLDASAAFQIWLDGHPDLVAGSTAQERHFRQQDRALPRATRRLPVRRDR
jgi:hypothetical protein